MTASSAAPVPVSAPGNPFTPGIVVPPERFYGRSHELREILDNLEGMRSVSLVGEARIGKTSLLRYLAAHLPGLLDERGRYLPIYISVDGLHDQAGFCRAVLDPLLANIPAGLVAEQRLRTLEQRLSTGPAVTLDETAKLLEELAQQQLRVVLLLDEFKHLIEHPQEFDEIFCNNLRSLYTNSIVALLLATRQPLDSIQGLNQYFLNGLGAVIPLRNLDDDGAAQLLGQPHDRPFSPAEIAMGLATGKNHPFRLQLAGDRLYRWKAEIPGPLYDEPGKLKENAARVLLLAVQEKYEQTMKLSRGQPRRTSQRQNWLTALGAMSTWLGSSVDNAKSWWAGIIIVTLLGSISILAFACFFGIITPQQCIALLHRLMGGN